MEDSTFGERLAQGWAVIRCWVMILCGFVALGWFYYFLTTLGPRRVVVKEVRVRSIDAPALCEAKTEVERLEQIYWRAVDADLVTAEAIEALAEAQIKQTSLVRTYPQLGQESSDRLANIERELGSARARWSGPRLRELEREGEAALEAGRLDVAEPIMRQAFALQAEINRSLAEPRYKDYVRETALQQALQGIEATPLHMEVMRLAESARAAAQAQQWSGALSGFTAARDLQDRINREYPKTRYADLTASVRFETEIVSLAANGLAEELDVQEKDGDVALQAGETTVAAKAYSRAFILQKEVNRKFSASRFVSAQRLEALEAKRQTALSAPEVALLARLEAGVAADLRGRRIVAAGSKISEAEALAAKLAADFPKSQLVDSRLKIKFSYLALRRADLRAMQDGIYEALVPLPSMGERLMLKTEVPQALYVLVMNTNPSRNPGRTFPVDSVSWMEAQACCERLGWILGASVRLPSEKEFCAARTGVHNDTTRVNEVVAVRSYPVGEGTPNSWGFYDLDGNVSEWLAAEEPETERVLSAGGSYLAEAGGGDGRSLQSHRKTDRARHIGFRIVVELLLETNG